MLNKLYKKKRPYNLGYVFLTNFDIIGIKCSTPTKTPFCNFSMLKKFELKLKRVLISYGSGRQMRETRNRTFHYPSETARKCTHKKSVLKNVSWHVPSVLSCILLVMTILIYVIHHCHFELLTSWILFACSRVLIFKHAHWWIRPCWNDVSVICTQGHISSVVTCTCILYRSTFLRRPHFYYS